MDGAVLADLERREVEPERRQLPAEFGQLAPGDSGQPVVDERRLELGELGVELRSVGVVARTRSRLPGHRRARPPQSLGDEPEALAIRLVGESPPQLPVGLRQVLRIAREPHPERSRDPGMRCRRRDGLHEAQGHGFEPVEHVIGMDAERPFGQVGRHGRVAVAVATDPRPVVQEGRDARRPLAGVLAEGRIDRAVQPGREREQRRVEERHRGSHLIERLRGDRADVGRPPQLGDLLAEAASDLPVIGRGQARVVEPLQQRGAATQSHERRPPAGLGRVRGEDRRDRQSLEDPVEVGLGAPGTTEARDRLGDRVVEHAIACRAFAPPQRAHARPRLGEVDQLEIEREGRDDRLGVGELERVELRFEPATDRGIVVVAERDRREPQPFDEVEDRLPCLFDDDLAEQRTEQAHFEGERVACPCRADAGWLGTPACRTSAAHGAHRSGTYRNQGATLSQPCGRGTVPTLVRWYTWPVVLRARPSTHRPLRRRGRISSTSFDSSITSRVSRPRRARGTSCSRRSSTAPATPSMPMCPRSICSTGMERT